MEVFFAIMEYFVYILISDFDSSYYVGMAKNVARRLNEHNKGKSQFTKSKIPWRIVLVEGPFETIEARRLEKYYKTTNGKNQLRKKGLID